ncbi:uncharacterized protein LOC124120425 [Haliotis rufescens]|uniref:uncharacterized protein LOC124120425 n=1 Tax=Haliotis rufescens TaxID=6454 RepID=UPI00201F34E2|nr:uncharacterized protein LOC124120425 [Haliotis rufescens]
MEVLHICLRPEHSWLFSAQASNMKVETITQSGVHITGNQKLSRTPFTSIEDKLQPILMSMKIFGIYFDPTQAKNKVEPSETYTSQEKPPRLWRSINRLYCYTVLLLLWFNVGRCAIGVFPLNEGLPLRIILMTWMLLCALNATIVITACQKLTHLRCFYKHWDSLFQCPVTDSLGCGFLFSRHYCRVGTAAGWFVSLVNIAALCVFMFGNLPLSPVYITTFARPFPESQLVVIFSVVLHVFQSGAWIFPIIFMSITSRVIRAQFFRFGQVLSKQIEQADGHIPHQLPELRFRYTQLCQAVDIINRSYKWLLGTCFILNIFLACFVSYEIINGPLDTFVITVNVFWLGGSVVCILVLAISSSDVHDAAHSLLDDIFSIGTRDASVEQLGQLNLFVSKLTGTSIGFTAIDFFVITKEFLLTLGGLFMTYFFLLLQFKIA